MSTHSNGSLAASSRGTLGVGESLSFPIDILTTLAFHHFQALKLTNEGGVFFLVWTTRATGATLLLLIRQKVLDRHRIKWQVFEMRISIVSNFSSAKL